jgi:hypothetical protein
MYQASNFGCEFGSRRIRKACLGGRARTPLADILKEKWFKVQEGRRPKGPSNPKDVPRGPAAGGRGGRDGFLGREVASPLRPAGGAGTSRSEGLSDFY